MGNFGPPVVLRVVGETVRAEPFEAIDMLNRANGLVERLGKMIFDVRASLPILPEGTTKEEQATRSIERERQLNRRLQRVSIEAVIDSLAGAANPGGVEQRLVQLVAEYSGMLWEVLTPRQREAVEPYLRRWMEHRAAAGTPVTIPGMPRR